MPIRAAPVSDESIPPIRLRIRPRRPPLPAPSACPSTFPTSSAAVNSSNQDATDITKRSIRQLRVAFEETPLKLRELEEGWRARRIRVLGEMTDQTVLVRGESRDGALMVSGVASIHQQRGLSKEPGNLPEFTCPIRRVSRNDIPTAKVLHIGPLRNAPTYAVVARPTRDPPEMQSVIRKIPIATAPPTPPASPRSSLRRPSSPPLVGPSVAPAGRPTAPHTALPILAQPLPPTSHPIPVSRGSPKDTIHVESHPSATELVISLKSGKQVIQVLRGGLEVVLDDRTLRSDEQSHWDIRQRKEWEMVQSLVERVKRSTPRVRALHQGGYPSLTSTSS